MKILFYLHQYPAFGGIETVTTLLAKAFAEDGHEIRVVSFITKPGTDLLAQLPSSVRWHQLPEPALDSAANRAALRGILDEFAPDKIIFQDSYANIHTMLFDVVREWREGAAPNIITVEHSTPEFLRRPRKVNGNPLIRILKRIVLTALAPHYRRKRLNMERARRTVLLANSRNYVTLAQAYADIVRKLVGKAVAGNKLLAIPNPIKTYKTYEYDPKKKRKEILFVGSLLGIKGVHRLLAAWEKLFARHPDWELVIVGDGVERARLEELAAERKLPRVRFEGFSASPEKYYETASIFVMASDFEGFPMVLGEAMSHGVVPVIYSSFAAAPEIVDDGTAGFAIPAYKRGAFCKTLSRLMSDSAFLQAHARASLTRAEAFSMASVKREWYNLLNSLETRGGG